MEQETRVCIFLSLLWKELIGGVSEFPLAISGAGCQLIAHLPRERGTRSPSWLLPTRAAPVLFPGPARAAWSHPGGAEGTVLPWGGSSRKIGDVWESQMERGLGVCELWLCRMLGIFCIHPSIHGMPRRDQSPLDGI